MIETKLETITPDLAEELLKSNIKNRSVSPKLVEKYANDMLNNLWGLTHQGIALYEDYTIADGQHRLMAIVKSKRPQKMLVTYGLAKEQSVEIDVHRPRSVMDGITIGGFSEWINSRHVAMANFLTHPTRLSTQQTVLFLEDIKHSAQFAIEHLASNRRYLTQNIIYAAVCIAHLNGVSPTKLARFCALYYSGNVEGKTENAVIRLRDEFMNNTKTGWADRWEKYLKAQRAIQAFAAGESLSRLVLPREPIYTLGGYGK